MSPPTRYEQDSVPAEDPDSQETEALEPDETPTPVWLPFVGLGLALLLLAVFFAVPRSPTQDEERSQAPSQSVELPSGPKANPPSPAAEVPGVALPPAAQGTEPARRPDPGCGP